MIDMSDTDDDESERLSRLNIPHVNVESVGTTLDMLTDLVLGKKYRLMIIHH